MKNKVIIDWLTFTSKCHNHIQMIEFLGLTTVTFTSMPGLNGYKSRLVYGGISIMYDGFKNDMGVCVNISGHGCRDFETYSSLSWAELLNNIVCYDELMNITRLDVAYDDFENMLNMDVICNSIQNHMYVSKAHEWEVVRSSKGTSAYIGSEASLVRFRFYDKAAEQKITDGTHWVRMEMQLRKERAVKFVQSVFTDDNLKSMNRHNFGDYITLLFSFVVNNYLRFVEDDSSSSDSNMSRRKAASWWIEFIGTMDKISIFTEPGTEYNEDKLYNYVFGQAGNSIYTYISAFGIESFIKELCGRGTQLSGRQLNIINKFEGNRNCIEKSTGEYFDFSENAYFDFLIDLFGKLFEKRCNYVTKRND